MHILAIESSSDIFSVALAKDDQIIASKRSDQLRSASELCAQYVDDLLREQNLTVDDMEYIVVNKGPGSFTGLRIGMSFALGFSYGHEIPVIAISSFESLGQHKQNDDTICIIESKRDEVYYSYDNENIKKAKKTDLAETIGSRQVLTNAIKDLATYLPENKIVETELDAETLCRILIERIKTDRVDKNEDLHLLYMSTFQPNKT